MLEFYQPIKIVHIVAVLCSGLLFLARGLLLLNGRQWAMAAPIRYASYSIDTVLLTAALMLATMLPSAMFANGWLAVKLVLLLAYIVLGSMALKRGGTLKIRWACFMAAGVVYTFMLSVAYFHHPLGYLAPIYQHL